VISARIKIRGRYVAGSGSLPIFYLSALSSSIRQRSSTASVNDRHGSKQNAVQESSWTSLSPIVQEIIANRLIAWVHDNRQTFINRQVKDCLFVRTVRHNQSSRGGGRGCA